MSTAELALPLEKRVYDTVDLNGESAVGLKPRRETAVACLGLLFERGD